MDCVPIADERNREQRRRNDEHSSGLERVHVMPVTAGASLLHGGGHGHIVAPEKACREWRIRWRTPGW